MTRPRFIKYEGWKHFSFSLTHLAIQNLANQYSYLKNIDIKIKIKWLIYRVLLLSDNSLINEHFPFLKPIPWSLTYWTGYRFLQVCSKLGKKKPLEDERERWYKKKRATEIVAYALWNIADVSCSQWGAAMAFTTLQPQTKFQVRCVELRPQWWYSYF